MLGNLFEHRDQVVDRDDHERGLGVPEQIGDATVYRKGKGRELPLAVARLGTVTVEKGALVRAAIAATAGMILQGPRAGVVAEGFDQITGNVTGVELAHLVSVGLE